MAETKQKFTFDKCATCVHNIKLQEQEIENLKIDGVQIYKTVKDRFKWSCQWCIDKDWDKKCKPHELATHWHNVEAYKSSRLLGTWHPYRFFGKMTAESGLGKALKWWYDNPGSHLKDFKKACSSNISAMEAFKQAHLLVQNEADKTYAITQLGIDLLKEYNII